MAEKPGSAWVVSLCDVNDYRGYYYWDGSEVGASYVGKMDDDHWLYPGTYLGKTGWHLGPSRLSGAPVYYNASFGAGWTGLPGTWQKHGGGGTPPTVVAGTGESGWEVIQLAQVGNRLQFRLTGYCAASLDDGYEYNGDYDTRRTAAWIITNNSTGDDVTSLYIVRNVPVPKYPTLVTGYAHVCIAVLTLYNNPSVHFYAEKDVAPLSLADGNPKPNARTPLTTAFATWQAYNITPYGSRHDFSIAAVLEELFALPAWEYKKAVSIVMKDASTDRRGAFASWDKGGSYIPGVRVEYTQYAPWFDCTNYIVGDNVSHNNGEYRAVDSSHSVEPGVDEGWEDYWDDLHAEGGMPDPSPPPAAPAAESVSDLHLYVNEVADYSTGDMGICPRQGHGKQVPPTAAGRRLYVQIGGTYGPDFKLNGIRVKYARRKRKIDE